MAHQISQEFIDGYNTSIIVLGGEDKENGRLSGKTRIAFGDNKQGGMAHEIGKYLFENINDKDY